MVVNDDLMKETSLEDLIPTLLTRLTGTDVTKPRQAVPFNLWAKENKTLIDKEFNKRCNYQKPNKAERLNLRASMTRELFNKLSDGEKRDWVEKAKREHKEALEKWEATLAGPASMEPADRQRYFQAYFRQASVMAN